MIPQMNVVADLTRSEDWLSLKPGDAVGDCHARGPVRTDQFCAFLCFSVDGANAIDVSSSNDEDNVTRVMRDRRAQAAGPQGAFANSRTAERSPSPSAHVRSCSCNSLLSVHVILQTPLGLA